MAIINGAITAAPTPAPQAVTAPGLLGGTDTTQQPTPATSPNASAPAASPVNGPLSAPTTTTVGAPGAGGVAQVGQPQPWQVTPDQTVEGRIQSIISAGNPIIQMARTKALEGMNSRGLVNSSMAQQASDAAAYQAALPIAQADAATASKAASYNADEANQFGLQDMQAQNQRGLQQLTGQTQVQMQQLQNDNSKLLQTNNQAATAFNQALVSMTNVNLNDKMDATAKTEAIAQIQRDLQSQLKALSATSGLNLSSQLNFAGYDGFDGNGNYVGFNADGSTAAPAPGAAAAPAPVHSVTAPAPAAAPGTLSPGFFGTQPGVSYSA